MDDEDWDSCDDEFGLCLECGRPLTEDEYDTCDLCYEDQGVAFIPKDEDIPF